MEGTKLNSRNTVRAKLKRTDYPARKAGRYEGGEETGSDWPAHFLLSLAGGHVVQVNCPIYPDISEYAAFTVSG
jgi:hypothetical protein